MALAFTLVDWTLELSYQDRPLMDYGRTRTRIYKWCQQKYVGRRSLSIYHAVVRLCSPYLNDVARNKDKVAKEEIVRSLESTVTQSLEKLTKTAMEREHLATLPEAIAHIINRRIVVYRRGFRSLISVGFEEENFVENLPPHSHFLPLLSLHPAPAPRLSAMWARARSHCGYWSTRAFILRSSR